MKFCAAHIHLSSSSSSVYSVLFFALHLHHLYLCAYSGAALAEFFVFVGLQPTFLMLHLILQDLLLILLSAHIHLSSFRIPLALWPFISAHIHLSCKVTSQAKLITMVSVTLIFVSKCHLIAAAYSSGNNLSTSAINQGIHSAHSKSIGQAFISILQPQVHIKQYSQGILLANTHGIILSAQGSLKVHYSSHSSSRSRFCHLHIVMHHSRSGIKQCSSVQFALLCSLLNHQSHSISVSRIHRGSSHIRALIAVNCSCWFVGRLVLFVVKVRQLNSISLWVGLSFIESALFVKVLKYLWVDGLAVPLLVF